MSREFKNTVQLVAVPFCCFPAFWNVAFSALFLFMKKWEASIEGPWGVSLMVDVLIEIVWWSLDVGEWFGYERMYIFVMSD